MRAVPRDEMKPGRLRERAAGTGEPWAKWGCPPEDKNKCALALGGLRKNGDPCRGDVR